ncbi:hypothetical protein D3C72_1100730 [compost metagenome]
MAQRGAGVATGHRHVAEQDRRAHIGRVLLARAPQPRHGVLGTLFLERVLRQFAAELGDLHAVVLLLECLQLARGINGLLPFLLDFVQLQQHALGRRRVRARHQPAQRLLGAVEQSGAQEVLAQFIERVLALGLGQVRARGQVLMDADRALGLAPAAEQRAQRKVEFGGFRVEPGHLDEGVDGLVRLLVEQEIEALEIRARQCALLADQLAQVEPRRHPAKAKDKRQYQQPPGFKHHGSDFRADYVIGNTGLGLGRHGVRRHRHARLGQRAAQARGLHPLTHQCRRHRGQRRDDTQPERGQQNQDQRRMPHGAKEQLQGRILGVAQCQDEQQGEQDDAENPGDEFHAVTAIGTQDSESMDARNVRHGSRRRVPGIVAESLQANGNVWSRGAPWHPKQKSAPEGALSNRLPDYHRVRVRTEPG